MTLVTGWTNGNGRRRGAWMDDRVISSTREQKKSWVQNDLSSSSRPTLFYLCGLQEADIGVVTGPFLLSLWSSSSPVSSCTPPAVIGRRVWPRPPCPRWPSASELSGKPLVLRRKGGSGTPELSIIFSNKRLFSLNMSCSKLILKNILVCKRCINVNIASSPTPWRLDKRIAGGP